MLYIDLVFMLVAIILLVINSLTADFEQEKQSQLFVEAQHSTGVLEYRAPDYLRWEYVSPQSLIWEIEGETGNVNKQIVNMLMLIKQCVKGDFEAAKTSFNVAQEGELVTLIPKKREMQRFFRKIDIRLNTETGIAKQVVIYEANDDCTTIRFKNVRTN